MVAVADVSIRQVQVVDKTGQIRSIVLWQCGPDLLYADTLDGLFDNTRRRRAPEWLVAQLKSLPADRRFDAEGQPKAVSVGDKANDHIPSSDADAPDFVQG